MANEFLDKAGLQQVWNRILDLFSPKNHSHKIEDTTELQSTLDGKAALSHTHDDYLKKVAESDLDINGHFIKNISNILSHPMDGRSADTIFTPYYSYSDLGTNSGDYESFFKAWLKVNAANYPNMKAIFIGQVTPAYRSFIISYIQSTTLTSDGYPKYASGLFFSYKENEAYHFLFDNGTFKMNKVVTGEAGDKNIIEAIKMNGVALVPDSQKTVNLNIDLSPYAEKSELNKTNENLSDLEREVADWYSKGFDYSKLTDEEKAQIKQDVTTVNAQFSKVYNVSGEQSVFDIGIERYAHGIDILEVYINGMRLVEGVDYSNDGQRITLTKPLNVIGQLEIVVFKSVAANVADLASFKGEKGDKGDRGEQGIQGIQGVQGEQGIQGEKGESFVTTNFPLTNNSGAVYVSANVGKITNGNGFSVIIQSRGGETVWLNCTANDSGFTGYAARMTNSYGKTAEIWYDQTTGYIYTKQNAWSNLVSFTVVATTFSMRQLTVSQVSSIPSTAKKIDITDVALKTDIPTVDTSTFVPTTRTINNKALSEDITLSASDVGAYTTSEVDSLVANAGGGGSSDVANKALRVIAGSEDSGDNTTSFNLNSDAEIDSFIETSIVKWAKYRGITNGLPNGDGLVQSIGWRSPTDGAGWGRQIAYDDESHNIYSRYLGNGSWSAWKKLLVDGDINLSGYVPTSRTVNGKALSSNISISASDLGATKLSYTTSITRNSWSKVTLPSCNVGEIKLVKASLSSVGAGEYVGFYTPSGGTYVIFKMGYSTSTGGNGYHSASYHDSMYFSGGAKFYEYGCEDDETIDYVTVLFGRIS